MHTVAILPQSSGGTTHKLCILTTRKQSIPMPVFICENCNETLKKNKVATHNCGGGCWYFSCMDCNRKFGWDEYLGHTTCVSEAERYQGALYVPKDTEIDDGRKLALLGFSNLLLVVHKKMLTNTMKVKSETALTLYFGELGEGLHTTARPTESAWECTTWTQTAYSD